MVAAARRAKKSACTRRSTSNTVASMPQSALSSTRRSRSDERDVSELARARGEAHVVLTHDEVLGVPRPHRGGVVEHHRDGLAAAQLARHGLDHLVRLGNPELVERRQAHHGAAHELARRVKQRAHALGVRLRPRRADVDLEQTRGFPQERPHAWPGLGPQPRIRHPVQGPTRLRARAFRAGTVFRSSRVLRLDLCGDARLEQRVRAVSRAVLDRRAVQQRVVEIEHQPELASVQQRVDLARNLFVIFDSRRVFRSGDVSRERHLSSDVVGPAVRGDEGWRRARELRAPRDVFENRFVVCSPLRARAGVFGGKAFKTDKQ